MASFIEYALSNGILTVLAVFFTVFTVLNLAGEKFGSFGAKFLYEMDEIMGGLLGIPNYSKVEAIFTGLGALGLWSIWFTGGCSRLFLYSAGLLEAYLFLCASYAYFAKQPVVIFASMGLFIDMIAAHRYFRFSTDVTFGELVVLSVVLIAFVTAGTYRMYKLAPSREAVNARFVKIVEYCNENPDFVWIYGKDAPEGFAEEIGFSEI